MLPEDSSPEEIVSWFRDQGWELTLHIEALPLEDVPRLPRAIRKVPRFSHWADLVSVETGNVVARWYGGGMNEAEAVKSARRRWRTEQEPSPSQPAEGQRRRLP